MIEKYFSQPWAPKTLGFEFRDELRTIFFPLSFRVHRKICLNSGIMKPHILNTVQKQHNFIMHGSLSDPVCSSYLLLGNEPLQTQRHEITSMRSSPPSLCFRILNWEWGLLVTIPGYPGLQVRRFTWMEDDSGLKTSGSSFSHMSVAKLAWLKYWAVLRLSASNLHTVSHVAWTCHGVAARFQKSPLRWYIWKMSIPGDPG